ncbi:MAG: AI-2E family transporter [Deltaproteobacteria bacterium]|nr:AI-2E family transporter [Deltaproteobacteria bacterium]
MLPLFKDWRKKYLSDPQMIILALMLILGFGIVFFLGKILMPVFASLVIAYLLEGLVTHLQRWKIPRLAAVVIVFLSFIAGLFVLFIWFFPMLSRQISQFIQQLPAMLVQGQKQLMQLPERYPDFISAAQIQQIFDTISANLTVVAKRLLSWSLASVMGIFTLVVYLILVPFLVFFFLKDKARILTWVRKLLPDNLDLTTTVWFEVNKQLANYIRGKGWEILIVWVISYIVFKVLGMEYTLLLSFFIGLSVILPYIGVTVMFLPVAMIAYFQWGWGGYMVYALIAYAAIQIVDGNILAPLLLSGVIDLHPTAIIISVLMFGGLWGIWGVFFAIPLATLVNTLIKTWLLRLETDAGEKGQES